MNVPEIDALEEIAKLYKREIEAATEALEESSNAGNVAETWRVIKRKLKLEFSAWRLDQARKRLIFELERCRGLLSFDE